MYCLCHKNKAVGGNAMPADLREKTMKHPCYSFGAHHRYARMHLPVAPRCNISCNYCNRKYDCVNESRPGVTSEVLTPEQARDKYDLVADSLDNLSVVGIAGPGDALANWEETKRTIELISRSGGDVIFCLSTNGLMLPDYAREITGLGVRHVTVTVNCVDPEIGKKIYHHINYRGQRLRGAEGAEVLLGNQLEGIKLLVDCGAVVKVNIVMIKDVNDRHIPDIVKKLRDLGVFITNIMPLIPARGSVFESYPRTGESELNNMRNTCGEFMRQMYHCRQCRADAIGLLTNDRSSEFRALPGRDKAQSAGGNHRRARAG
ncbi:MAG: nitrogenase cofactor biosynthesis protein NifB [Bacillota bacterium]